MSQPTNDDLLDEYPSLRYHLETPNPTRGIPKVIEIEVHVEEFPSNSRGPTAAKKVVVEEKKAPEKNIQKVVSGEVIQRKPSLGRRFKSLFLGGDSQSVKDYVIGEVLVPALKDTIADAVTGGIERIVFGDNVRPGRRGVRGVGPGANQFNYAGISMRNQVAGSTRPDPRPQLSRQARLTHTFDEVIFPSRSDAEAVLAQMFDLLDQFEVVTVSDFLELSGISGNFTDHKFGWDDLRGVQAHRTRGGGYILGLPDTKSIE